MFGPSVGARALSMRQALLVAAVFEFLGAVLMVGGWGGRGPGLQGPPAPLHHKAVMSVLHPCFTLLPTHSDTGFDSPIH